MKHTLFFLICLCGLLGLCSCSDDGNEGIIWDISPAQIYVRLVDESGQNLLEPNVEGNWLDSDITAMYKNDSYDVRWKYWEDEIPSRAYMPTFRGLYWNIDWTNNPVLCFGEFDGAENQDVDITLNFPFINKEYDIRLVHKCKWSHNKPEIKNYIYLDGKKQDGNEIEIVLPARVDE